MLTLSNTHIENNLKGANMWFHTNNYFQGMIQNITPTLGTAISVGKTNFMAVVNVTENEIIIIPVDTANKNVLQTDKAIYLCYEDIDYVESIRGMGASYIQVNAKKNNEVVFSILINAFLPAEQTTHYAEFVKTFRNNGTQLPTSTYGSSQSYNSTTTTQVSPEQEKAAAVIFCVFAFMMMIFITLIFVGTAVDGNYSGLIPVMLFDFVFTIGLVGVLKNALTGKKDAPLYNDKAKTPTTSTRETDFTTSDNIIGSDSPIVTEDEDYGGIKKL